MGYRRKRRIRALLLLWFSAFVLTVAAQILDSGATLQELMQNPRKSIDGLILTFAVCVVGVLVIDAVNRKILPAFRRWPLLLVVPVSATLYLVSLFSVVMVVAWLLVLIVLGSPAAANQQIVRTLELGQIWVGMLYLFGIALFLTFMVEFFRRIGIDRIVNWLSGRYRRPREEMRVFLLIDLRGSTRLAETLGSVRFSYLLRDCFSDLTDPVLETGGDVVAYVGDEAIVSWPVRRAIDDGNALRCFVMYREMIARSADRYRREYGEVPEFKGALHMGPIVATEVGEIRTELQLHGDALNTASRMLAECNELGADLLVSEEIGSLLEPVKGVSFETVGPLDLRGKGSSVGVLRAVFDGSAAGQPMPERAAKAKTGSHS